MKTSFSYRDDLWLWILIFLLISASVGAEKIPFFKVQVVDEETGRGVPLVELKTVNEICYVTDSNGTIAFQEPGLMNREVFFYVRSHGYSFPADGFGMEGVRLMTTPGGESVIRIKRINIAERLYRITGQGIYRDSILLGMKVPLREPVLNGKVMGQDSAFAIPYHGKIHWFWGDTSKPSYPLGNFRMSGAVSQLPAQGGLSPDAGIDLHYFVDDQGFCKSMCPIRPGDLIWLDGFVVFPDPRDKEKMVAHYSHRKSLEQEIGHGLVIFDDEKQEFIQLTEFNINKSWQSPHAHPICEIRDDVEYVYFPTPFPTIRVRKHLTDLQNQDAYEAFTCLMEGTRFQGKKSKIDIQNGKPFYSWKHHTEPINPQQEKELMEAGLLKPEDAHFLPLDKNSGEFPLMHSGSIRWNEYRKKWIMIAVEIGGQSFLGEVWYLESKELMGPWKTARKIVTHNKYSFYNPVHHPFFDQRNGRIIYFEGTYSRTFSGNELATPRYDYNQIMYRLDLAHPALELNR
ncbi:MAG: hypothetical protein C4527_10690 [Candidatus Omnitrophota bacterium]|jgi:hypothetical protein|nr:MAG: hypothetical protein C4527_10690 [Candidatus Omnitrophota bacterium]